jgi:hypothetical protein
VFKSGLIESDAFALSANSGLKRKREIMAITINFFIYKNPPETKSK